MKMNTINRKASKSGGFTLMEILIVLAVLGLIAALVMPSIGPIRTKFAIRGVLHDADTLKADVIRFVDEYGPPPITEGLQASDVATYTSGTNFAASTAANLNSALRFDMALSGAQLMEHYFSTSLGASNPPPTGYQTNAIVWNPTVKKFTCSPDATVGATHSWAGIPRVECQRVVSGNPDPSTVAGTNFWLNGDQSQGLGVGSKVVVIVIENISGTDAYNLAKSRNPEFLDSAAPGAKQSRGQVVFAAPDATTGLTTAYVYVWHGNA